VALQRSTWDALEWRYSADAPGTEATFYVENPPLCAYTGYGSASAAWVGLVNQAAGMIAQAGWAENYPNSAQGFYEYTTTDGVYHYFAINGGETGSFQYHVHYTSSTGAFTFYQDSSEVGSTGNLGWVPYWNYVSSEVHYNSDYNAGDPSTKFTFSSVNFDGQSLSTKTTGVTQEHDGTYQNIGFSYGQSSFQVWDSRSWNVIVGG
jgi:hypothetical protein